MILALFLAGEWKGIPVPRLALEPEQLVERWALGQLEPSALWVPRIGFRLALQQLVV